MSAREAIFEAGADTITTLTQALAEAERRAVVARDELAHLARDGEHSLRVLREQCERICARMPAIEQMTRSVLEEGSHERRAHAVAGAELEQLRREKHEVEQRLRAQLDLATNANFGLRTRLALCEQALLEREADVERERELADEAMRWAARVEGEHLLRQSPAVTADDIAPELPAVVPISTRHRRQRRVRIRHAS